MHWIYIAILAFIGFATLAMMIREGMWNNAVTIVIHVFSGLAAFAFYGQTARFLDESVTDGSFTYWMDFLALWAVYVITFIVLRIVTSAVSRERVRFKMPVEWTGSIISAILGAYLVSGFVGATMHTVMLPADFLGGAILAESKEDVELKLTRPDIAWLRLYGAVIDRVMPSTTALRLTGRLDDGIAPWNSATQLPEYRDFIPDTELPWGDVWARLFIVHYKDRRADFAAAPGLRVTRGASQ
jgi:hypothetical protein